MAELQGKALVLLGRFSKSKKLLQQELLKVGAKVRAEVSKNTDYLVEGQTSNSGTSFYNRSRAERMGTPIIDEETLFAWLEAAPAVELTPEPPKEPEPDAEELEPLRVAPEELRGKQVVVCGRFYKRNKEQVLFILEEFGAVRANEVTSKTDYVVSGKKGAARLKKALELGIPVINEKGFLTLVEAYEAGEPEVELTEEQKRINLRLFEYQECCITGEFDAFSAAQLRKILRENGVRVRREVHEQTGVVMAGRNWDNALREVLGRYGSVWTEGQILLYLDGCGQMDFPKPEHIPNGAQLDALEALETGELPVHLPEDVEGELVLRWKRVHFPIHLRFAEEYGHIYRGMDKPYVGRLFFNGEELSPNTDAFYGAESFQVHSFWEDGNDLEGKELRFDGAHGFNCSFLFLEPDKEIHFTGKDGHYGLCHAWEERSVFGDVSVLCQNVDLTVNLETKTFVFTHHMNPYLVSPRNPWI